MLFKKKLKLKNLYGSICSETYICGSVCGLSKQKISFRFTGLYIKKERLNFARLHICIGERLSAVIAMGLNYSELIPNYSK